MKHSMEWTFEPQMEDYAREFAKFMHAEMKGIQDVMSPYWLVRRDYLNKEAAIEGAKRAKTFKGSEVK